MVWIAQKKPKYKDSELVRQEVFCLWPVETEEGIKVWLETVTLERKWHVLDGKGWFTSTYEKYYATDRQKAKLGLKW